MKVVVAHNRYSSAQPSGENTIVDAEIAALREAGVEVLPFIRSSDEIGTLPAIQKALLPISPIRAAPAQAALRVLHTVHNSRQVCANGLYSRDGHVCQDCRGRAFPLPAVVHSCYRGSRAQSAVMATALTVHRGTWRGVDRYLALTDAMAAHLRDFGIPDERIVVKPNSTPDPGPPAPLGEGFLFAGRLSAEKGLPLLLDAWSRNPVGTLRIAGDGPLRSAVESRSDVVFLGPQNHEGVQAAMRDSAVVLVPSTWHDVLPTVILEALAAGRPVLGTHLGGIPYLVGDAGWTVPPTVDALAEALPVAAAGAAERAPLARKRYESTFTPELITARLLGLYRSLTG